MTHKEQVEKKIRELCPELQLDTRGMSESERVWEDATATHAIHLEHVLRACASGPTSFVVSPSGLLWHVHAGVIGIDHIAYYDLTLPFSDQDPALYEFLHSILCGKE